MFVVWPRPTEETKRLSITAGLVAAPLALGVALMALSIGATFDFPLIGTAAGLLIVLLALGHAVSAAGEIRRAA